MKLHPILLLCLVSCHATDALVTLQPRHQLKERQRPSMRLCHRTFVPLSHPSRRVLLLSATKSKIDDDIAILEQQVIASAQASMDAKRLLRVLDDSAADNHDQQQSVLTPNAPWKIAMAAAAVTSTASFAILDHNLAISALIFLVVFVMANKSPVDDDDDDNLTGAMTRSMGRLTLASLQAIQPRVKALARLLVTGHDEILELQTKNAELCNQVAALRLWKRQRLFADQALANYSLDDLKDRARRYGLNVGGSKMQLLLRLVEANIIVMDDNDDDDESF